MRKKSTTTSPLKRPSTRSISVTKTDIQSDKYTFHSDDEDHKAKPVFIRESITIKRSRSRSSKIERIPKRASLSSNIESDSGTEESLLTVKRNRSGKYSYEKPVTRRVSRLVSQTNTPIRDKSLTSKKRGRKPKMLNTIDEQDKSQQQIETENIVPSQSMKYRYVKKKTISSDINTKNDFDDDDSNNQKLSTIDEKVLMQFGSPQHQTHHQQQDQFDDDFSDDSVEFVWKGSSKMSIEILKRRIPKDEQRDNSSTQFDPTAQRKRAIIPRLTNFDALSGQSIDSSSTTTKRSTNENLEQNSQKKANSIIKMNNEFQNDFVPSYNDRSTKMTTTNDKPRPRIYAVKSTTMKSNLQQPEIKRPKWMNNQQEKFEDDDDDDDNLPPSGEEPNDYDYMPKGQYVPKRPNHRGRGTYPGRRGTGIRGRPPGSRRHYHTYDDDDDDDDYDQYEEINSRYGSRRQTSYRPIRKTFDRRRKFNKYFRFK